MKNRWQIEGKEINWGPVPSNVVIITGVLGKTLATEQVLVQGKTAYAVDFDYYINNLCRVNPYSLWFYEEAVNALAVPTLEYLQDAASYYKVPICIAMSATVAEKTIRCLRADRKKLPQVEEVPSLSVPDTQELWRRRFLATGNWKRKGTLDVAQVADHLQKHKTAMVALLEMGVKVDALKLVSKIEVRETGYVNSARAYESLASSAKRLYEHLRDDDFSFRGEE